MRTLKKTLCVVLALAMMVGLCAVGASAAKVKDYPDADKITSKEAVNLLTALGVVEGFEDGTFRGDKSLTRAEGAKIVALLLGAKVDGLKSTFTDMSGHWADAYVAYCEGIGIIAGYGDGRFGPNDPLTYAHFAKMLLVALGYDAAREELVGAKWEIGVAKLVNQVNLAAQVADFDYNANINRNDAAQMGFNALLTPMVGYNGNGIAVADGNLATPREYLGNKAYDYRADFPNGDNDKVWNGTQWIDADPGNHTDGLMEMIENFFPNYKVIRDEDAYGFNSDIWFLATDRSDNTYKESKELFSAVTDVIMATYTTNVSFVSLDTLFKDAQFTNAMSGEEELDIIENGHYAGVLAGKPTRGNTTPGALAAYPGATVYLVDTAGLDGFGDTLIVKYPLLAKVSAITAAADSPTKARQIDLKVFYGDAHAQATTTVTFETETFAKGDFALVYPDVTIAQFKAKVAAAEAIDLIEVTSVQATVGTLTKVGTSTLPFNAGDTSTLTVDGTVYSVGAATFAAMGPEADVVYTDDTAKYGLNKEITLYLSNGFVLGVDTKAVPYEDYVFVVAVSKSATADMFTGDYTYTIGYVKQDGTTAKVTSTRDPGAIAENWCIMIPSGDTASFTAAKDEVQEKNVAIPGLKSDTPILDAGGLVVTNSKTNFVIRSGGNATTKTPITFKAYAGLASVPTFKGKDGQVWALKDSLGNSVAVFVDFLGKDADGNLAGALYFLSATQNGVIKDGTKTYYTFQTMNSKGEYEDVKLTAAALAKLTGTGLWIPTKDANGVITDLTAIDNTVPAMATYLLNAGAKGVDIKAGAGNITAGGAVYVVDADVAIYMYAAGQAAPRKLDLEDLNGKYGDIALVAAPNTTKVTTIYFVPQTKPAV